ncbi:MAG: hypothetical protein ABIS59_03465 [Candidatus Saccharibacteria bacterium]
MADSTSATSGYMQDRDKVLRSLHKLQGIVLQNDPSKLDLRHAHRELERLIHTGIQFDDFGLDDYIADRLTVLGVRLSKAITATGTIITFRQLASYQASELREIRSVGDGDILRIEAALASRGASCAVIVDWDEWIREYGRIIPEDMPGGDKRYAMVRRDLHGPIAFKSVWTWAGITQPFPAHARNDLNVRELGQILLHNRGQLIEKICAWTVPQPLDWRQQFAEESVDKMYVYIKEVTRLSWEYYNDDLLFTLGSDVLRGPIIDVLHQHELLRVGDLRRFLNEGIKLSEMDPGLTGSTWYILADVLRELGAKHLANQIEDSI